MTRAKAIGLIRVSSEAQAGPDRQGLPAQRSAVERIAELHGLELIELVEIRRSGARVLDDPAFLRVLDLIEAPDVHAVVCADLDRLMRPEDPRYYRVFAAFRDSGTVIYTSSGVRDYRQDRLLMTIESEIAALERERIAERTRRGREEKRKRGLRAEGGVGMPRGVSFDHATEKWSYVFPEADRVKEVFRQFLSSDGCLAYAEIGRQVGFDAGNGSQAVRSILKQPLYAGIYRVDRRWKRERGSDGKERVLAIPREPHESYAHIVFDPPLVPREDFDRVQELLILRRRRHPPRRDPNLQEPDYAGYLECTECGASFWVQPGNKRNRAA